MTKRVMIAKPRRPIGWILISPIAAVVLLLTVIVALALVLVMPRGSRNRNVGSVCANCGYLEQGYHAVDAVGVLRHCLYDKDDNWGWSEGDLVTWTGEFYKHKVRSLP